MIKQTDYNPYALKKYPESELRKEFSRQRSIVQKRLKRIIAAGLDRTGAYAKQLASLPKLRELQTNMALRSNLITFQRFITNRTTVSEIRRDREKRIESLQRYGLNWLTDENLDKFEDYMQYMREAGLIDNYGSQEVVVYYERIKDRQEAISDMGGDFRKWSDRRLKDPQKDLY